MAVLLFPDNTVLINFAIINRMELLARLANGNGRWCASVAIECHESSHYPGLGALTGAGAIFGEPLYPEPAEHQDLQLLRQELAGPGDPPGKQVGEAETLAIMTRRRVHGFFVTDDVEATRLAAKYDVPVVSTWKLLLVAARKKWVDADTLWGYVQTLRDHDRGTPHGVYDRTSFDKWLNS